MKLNHLFSLAVLLCVLLGVSCSSLYVPNQPNVPLMSEGDETHVGLNVGSNGYGAQLAYSPYYHWVLTGTANTFSITQDSNRTLKRKHSYGELGTGYYTRLSKIVRLEAIAGFGFGASGLPEDKGKYRRFYFQPSVGISSSMFDVGFTPRFAMVKHYESRLAGTVSKINENGVFFEPVITARLGFEQVKFQLQGGISTALGGTNIEFQNLFGSFGIHITLIKDFERY